MAYGGVLQRPLYAAAAVAAASFSTDLPNKLTPSNTTVDLFSSKISNPHLNDSTPSSHSSWVSHISASKLTKLSFVTKIRVPIPNINHRPISFSTANIVRNSTSSSSSSSSPVLINLYQSAKLYRASKPKTYSYTIPSVPSETLYRWHLPEPTTINLGDKSDCSFAKSRTVVVLLGWLGAKQKHLCKYAEWYTSRGINVITFTFPMSEVIGYQVGGKAEKDVELLVDHLAEWIEEEENGKKLVFHTFSNTGWLTYGVMLEKFQKHDPSLIGSIKGCIVDSAPVPDPDPQVYASGFSAAFLKKQSMATRGSKSLQDSAKEGSIITKTSVTESALLVVLEKFFGVVLNLPSVNRRLSDIVTMLSSKQPRCPQLYIYSSADRVIPAHYVESFIEQQRKSGVEVRSCDFVSTPHVDHFRNDPQLYTSQLTQYFEDCILSSCKGSV